MEYGIQRPEFSDIDDLTVVRNPSELSRGCGDIFTGLFDVPDDANHWELRDEELPGYRYQGKVFYADLFSVKNRNECYYDGICAGIYQNRRVYV